MRRVEVVLECDICQSPDDTHSRQFGIDGVFYVIDLCKPHSDQLDAGVTSFRVCSRRSNAKARSRASSDPSQQIRTWWRVHPDGLPQWRSNGKLPNEVKAQWRRRGAMMTAGR